MSDAYDEKACRENHHPDKPCPYFCAFCGEVHCSQNAIAHLPMPIWTDTAEEA